MSTSASIVPTSDRTGNSCFRVCCSVAKVNINASTRRSTGQQHETATKPRDAAVEPPRANNRVFYGNLPYQLPYPCVFRGSYAS